MAHVTMNRAGVASSGLVGTSTETAGLELSWGTNTDQSGARDEGHLTSPSYTHHPGLSSTTSADTVGLFGDLQVPYIVIIWVIALTSSLASIAMCFLCNYLQKRSRRRRQNISPLTTPSHDNSKSVNSQTKSPLKIANPLSCRDSCAICCEAYTGSEDEMIIGYIRSCGHYFHHHCVWRWTSVRGNCPLCRQTVNLKDGDMQTMTLIQLEQLLGVPNGTLRRKGSNRRKEHPDMSIINETTGEIRTISLTLGTDSPIVISEQGGAGSPIVISEQGGAGAPSSSEL